MKAFDLIKADYFRYWGVFPSRGGVFCKLILNKNHCFSYQVWLRLSDKSIIRPIARMIHVVMSSYYGIHIPPHTKIGPGLYINHGFGIFIRERQLRLVIMFILVLPSVLSNPLQLVMK